MIEFLFGAFVGAIAVVSVPAVNDLAVKARDWLYSKFKGDDDDFGPFVAA